MSVSPILVRLAPVATGILAFFIVVGPRVLDPTNIGWLGEGDQAFSYLGWLFFRDTGWSSPIGLNPDYGLEISSAIIFSDSIPLLAFLFKPFAALINEPFQYFGFFLLASFIFQAFFGWMILGLLTTDTTIKVLGTGLILFAPPMLFRLHAHFSLTAHFLILAGIYLNLQAGTSRQKMAWAALLAGCALIHAYFVAMVGALWIAHLAWRVIQRRVSLRSGPVEVVVVISVLAVVLWQTGYFSVSSGVAEGGFGFYRMNVLSIFDSNGWSYFLPDIDHASGNDEGFNYLGLGVIFLLICTVPAVLSRRVRFAALAGRFPVLFFTLILLTVFAISTMVTFGSNVWEYHIPAWILKVAGIFRASGRMFWPVFYLIVISFIYIVIRGYSTHMAAGILSFSLLLQVVDTSAGWLPLREKLMMTPESRWATSLSDPFWLQAASKYQKLRGIPLERMPSKVIPLAYYAGTNRLATDVVFLPRIDRAAWLESQENAESILESGNYEHDSLYVLGDNVVWRAGINMDPSSDVLARIDDLYVLVPGWKNCTDCLPLRGELEIEKLVPWVRSGERIMFNVAETSRAYLATGWSATETWGTWSDGRTADILLPLQGPVHSVIIEANALITPKLPEQRIFVRVDGELLMSEHLSERFNNRLIIPIPDRLHQATVRKQYIRIQLELPDAASPLQLGLGADAREMALGLVAITVL